MTPNKKFRRELGLSLIELMVALVIGLIIIAGIGYIYLQSNTGFRAQDNLTRMQEDIRFVQELMTRDLRSARYFGCQSPIDLNPDNPTKAESSNVGLTAVHPYFAVGSETWLEKDLTNNDNTSFMNLSYLLRGFGAGVGWPVPSGISGRLQTGTDTLMIVKIGDEGRKITNLNKLPKDSPTLFPTILTTSGSVIPTIPQPGRDALMVVSSCGGNGSMEFVKATVGASRTTFNLDNTLNVSRNAATPIIGLKEGNYTEDDAFIAVAEPVTYYVSSAASNPSSKLPGLHRVGIVQGPTTGAVGLWETSASGNLVVSGVENMRLRFLVDSDGDGAPNGYLSADEINALANANKVWISASAVQVSLTFVSQDETRTEAEAQPQFGITVPDKRIRQLVTFVVDVRNGTP
jgi:type IV pilus assembly protein PilW